jgi:hypothetical protein
MDMPSFSLYWHQNKEKPYHDALIEQGWTFVPLGRRADVLLVNHDMPQGDQRKSIDFYADQGAKIVTYPEGTGIYAYWDGIREPYRVDAALVLADGYKQAMDKWSLNIPIHVIGWSWSDIRPFQATVGRKVVFAPIHPDGFGVLEPGDIMWNRMVYERLIKMDIDLTVRYLGTLAQNGLWTVPKVIYKRGVYDNGNEDIERADVVVSTGTFAAKSVAMGKPTVTYPVASADNIYRFTKHFSEYAMSICYPYELTSPDALREMINAAQTESPALIHWRETWIGQPFDGQRLHEILTGLIDNG